MLNYFFQENRFKHQIMEQIKELIKTILFPVLFLVFIVATFLYLGGSSLQNNLIGSFGGALVGVILGFVAEMIREGIKEFQIKNRDKKTFLRLLEEDSKGAHHTLWLYKRLINDLNVPAELKTLLPAEFDLRYWDELSKNTDFLRLGSDKPFDKIFRIMWNLEKVNEQIVKAKTGNLQAFQFAHAFYNLTIEDKQTDELLKCFMDKEQVKKLENEWLEKAMANSQNKQNSS